MTWTQKDVPVFSTSEAGADGSSPEEPHLLPKTKATEITNYCSTRNLSDSRSSTSSPRRHTKQVTCCYLGYRLGFSRPEAPRVNSGANLLL